MTFNTLAAVHSDVVLEVVIRIIIDNTGFKGLVKIGGHCLTVKLAFVHLESKSDLTTSLKRRISSLVEHSNNLLSLLLEDITT